MIVDVNNFSSDAHLAHKNWMAFSYNNSLMLIQSINPFHVVSLAPSTSGEVLASTVSMQQFNKNIDEDWLYGHLYVTYMQRFTYLHL